MVSNQELPRGEFIHTSIVLYSVKDFAVASPGGAIRIIPSLSTASCKLYPHPKPPEPTERDQRQQNL
jgi:hypothetical protein